MFCPAGWDRANPVCPMAKHLDSGWRSPSPSARNVKAKEAATLMSAPPSCPQQERPLMNSRRLGADEDPRVSGQAP